MANPAGKADQAPRGLSTGVPEALMFRQRPENQGLQDAKIRLWITGSSILFHQIRW
jgi:hypothetical protein